MKLITKEIRTKLLANWTDDEGVRRPPLRLFIPGSRATWLVHSMNPDNPDTLFALCDPGFGFPELGYATLSELSAISSQVNLVINGNSVPATYRTERDKFFKPTHDLRTYAEAAYTERRITTDPGHLETASQSLARAA